MDSTYRSDSKPISTSASSSTPSSPTKAISHLPAKIKQSYAEIEMLSDDKLGLAERVVELLTRTCTRLNVDLNRAKVLQGESPTEMTTGHHHNRLPSSSSSVLASPVASTIGDSLKHALNASLGASDSRHAAAAVANTSSSSPAAPPTKKRKVTVSGTPSIKLPLSRSISPAAPPPAAAATTTTTTSATKSSSHTRSRLSRQSYSAAQNHQPKAAAAAAEHEVEDEDEDADDKLYCFCQKPSAGDMIGCDNEDACPYEWFHLECVGITEAPPDSTKWYCPYCINRVTRKGRKKT
ncbi:hypothetical protein D9757_006958 [Collybiopsis confluens]|uniref:PHD-type domain-containing protein n=1 Tax=Collybiopsis confluens TaxID=2823264 RepID=A0A8H5M7D3_9AGAR|nr:hypothetical protein D9757_006958 [Collybiopsis confluens]